MHKNFILIPGKKTYRSIDVETGLVTIKKQPKNNSERITNIMIGNNDNFHLLYRIEDNFITFFLTSKCNHRCIMCPQQLDIDAPDNDLIVQRVIDNLDYSNIEGICFTGGEPLLKMSYIEQVVKQAPENILITILSNGAIIPSNTILDSERCKICVPIYASYDELHNHLTGSISFYKIIENLMLISQHKILIELRYVLTKKNVFQLEEFARFVWRNLPFVQDVAFMGMELTAEAKKNKDDLWIDPREYIPSLIKAVEYLDQYNITTWIYNLPYCLFNSNYHKFLVQSISNWKIKYLPICEGCKIKSTCGGMFFSDVKDFEKIITENVK